MDDCWQGVGGWWLRLRLCRLLYCMGVGVELVLGVGEFHTSQCSAFQSGWESV